MGGISNKRFQMIKEEILYLKSIILDIKESASINDLYDLEKSSEFLNLNYSEKTKISKEKIEKIKPFLYFKCSEGCEIFVGKNSLGNEIILRNLGNKDDLWLFKNWTVLGTTILHENEWIEVLKHVGYTGDYKFTGSKSLKLRKM